MLLLFSGVSLENTSVTGWLSWILPNPKARREMESCEH